MNKTYLKAVIAVKEKMRLCRKGKQEMAKNGGFGMNELLGIAAALILAAFIIIPGLRTFATTVMSKLTSWWSGTVVGSIFPNT